MEEVLVVQDTTDFEAPADADAFENGAIGTNDESENQYLDLTEGGENPTEGVSKELSIPVISGVKADTVIIEFDFFQIDGWSPDMNDEFVVVINDDLEVSLGELASFTKNTPDASATTSDGITWERTTVTEGVDFPRDFGYNTGEADKEFRVTITE